MMNFRNLEYFTLVAQEESIRQAAKKLYISEQSLSEAIRRLEEELGTELLLRTRPCRLTPAGQIFLHHAQKILKQKELMLEEIEQVIHPMEEDKVLITIGPMGVPVFLPELIALFHKQYPAYEAEIRLKTDDRLDYFSPEELCFLPVSEREDLERIVLIQDRMLLVASSELLEKTFGRRLLEQLKQMEERHDILCLQELPFIDWKLDQANCFVEALRSLDQKNFSPKIVSYSKNIESNLEFCLQGLGALLIMEHILDYLLQKRSPAEAAKLCCFPIEAEDTSSYLALSYLRDKHLNAAEKAFIAVAREFFQQKESTSSELQNPS